MHLRCFFHELSYINKQILTEGEVPAESLPLADPDTPLMIDLKSSSGIRPFSL